MNKPITILSISISLLLSLWSPTLSAQCISGDCENGHGTFLWPNGDEYAGLWKNGNMDGQGTYHYGKDSEFEGDKYMGESKNNNNHGQGTYYYKNGDKYVGEWKDGKEDGQGTFYYNSGDKYVGGWKDGMFSGHGTYTYGLGSKWLGAKYVGAWKDDKKNGKGTYYTADGNAVSGMWRDSDLLYENGKKRKKE